jgi:bifunctional UDP-N-acetylglucosamine pyrophosphorylase/glucosamine-1-phosphate N-acetyltransferase
MNQSKINTPTAAIILAAGRGTRMRSELPKVMHKIAGQPMIQHVIAQAKTVGLSTLCTVIAPGMQPLADLACECDASMRIATQTQALGTAHAVLAARETLADFTGNLLVLYGDTPLLTAASMQRVLDALNNNPNCAVAVLGFTPADAGSYGRLVLNANGLLDRIVEAKDATDTERTIRLCNSGVMGLRGDVAWRMLEQIDANNAKQEFYLTDVVAIARKMGFDARAVEGDADEVLGVNSRSELAAADATFQTRARQMHMENGVTLLDPATVYFAADTVIAPDTIIEPNVFFGLGVSIGQGAHIRAFSHIEGASIGSGSIIGPFARLRPGTQLGEQVRIGNFVEIKKSEVANGAKINHLSYIGDSDVGAESNIGAGTITCNYDGYQKYRTTIGANVFVGSHSTLVSPITIGDGAMVAAGSVITENIEPDALALARPRQQQKPDWMKGFRAKQVEKK